MTAFVAQVPLRWTDQDAYRHLNHARAVTLLEEARIALFFDRAAADGVGTFSSGLLVVGLGVEYKRQVAYRSHTLRVAMTVDEVRAATFVIRYALHDGPDDDAPVAITAHTRMATFDLAAQRPRRLSTEEKTWLGGVGVTALEIPDADERGDLGAFIGRVVRLDSVATVRLRAAAGVVTAWASTPFDVLATRSVHGSLDPADVTLPASSLLTALSVERAGVVDPGSGGLWQGELPPVDGWEPVDAVPAEEIEKLTERGLTVARENAGPMGPPASLLDQTVLTVSAGAGPAVKVPMRCLFALSGMGFVAGDAGDAVRVSATGSWLRLDARYGAVVRRRLTALPLLLA